MTSPRAWRVYYDDGTTADDGAPLATIRGAGVIAIVQADAAPGDVYAVGRELLVDADFYWWETRWRRGDLYGLFDYLRRPGWKKVLAGRTVDRTVYKTTVARALADPDFPVKSAWQAGERRCDG